MSDRKNVVYIEPKLMASRDDSEQFKFKDMDCPTCNGNGFHYWGGYMEKFKKNIDDPDSEPCQRCNGTGKLCAIVDVKWKPEEKE